MTSSVGTFRSALVMPPARRHIGRFGLPLLDSNSVGYYAHMPNEAEDQIRLACTLNWPARNASGTL